MNIKTFHFDWDNNVINMPTMIIMFKNKDLDQPVYIPTDVFALIRQKIETDSPAYINKDNGRLIVSMKKGKKINLIDYSLIYENEESFVEFRDGKDCNRFLRDLQIAVKNKDLAPSYLDFLEATSSIETANHTSIITARGHSPLSIYEGLEWMREQGIIKHNLLIENIHPVSHKGSKQNSADKPSEKKKLILWEILKDIQESIKEGDVLTASFGFSDDDRHTFELIKDFLAEVKISKHIAVNLYFTGNGIKERLKL